MQLINPVLVGPPTKIHAIAKGSGIDISSFRLVAMEHSHEAAVRTMALCRSSECEALMGGSLHTDELVHDVVNAEPRLRTANRLRYGFLMEVPTYNRIDQLRLLTSTKKICSRPFAHLIMAGARNE